MSKVRSRACLYCDGDLHQERDEYSPAITWKCFQCGRAEPQEGTTNYTIAINSFWDRHRVEMLEDWPRLSPGNEFYPKWRIANQSVQLRLFKRWRSEGIEIPRTARDDRNAHQRKVMEAKKEDKPIHEKETDSPGKLYKCKKCDFTTNERYGEFGIVAHYNSDHSYHNEKKEEGPIIEETSETSSSSELKTIYVQPEVKPGEFCFLVTETDLARISSVDFNQIWHIMGLMIKKRMMKERDGKHEDQH